MILYDNKSIINLVQMPSQQKQEAVFKIYKVFVCIGEQSCVLWFPHLRKQYMYYKTITTKLLI